MAARVNKIRHDEETRKLEPTQVRAIEVTGAGNGWSGFVENRYQKLNFGPELT